jgi:hypothetical protein
VPIATRVRPYQQANACCCCGASFTIYNQLSGNSTPPVVLPWLKVPLLLDLVAKAEKAMRPRLFLFIDSDAFVRAQLTSIKAYFRSLELFPGLLTASWSILMAREDRMAGIDAFEGIKEEQERDTQVPNRFAPPKAAS